jgi:purine-binding chemotaxis protein CheW
MNTSLVGDSSFEIDPEVSAISHTGVQHIGFKVSEEEFLLPMEGVREIIMLPKITYVPRSNDAIEGIIALRGEIMPVLNLRRLLGFSKGETTPATRVIILQGPNGGFGSIVDEITDVVWLQRHEIETIAQNFFSSEYKVLAGVAKIGEKMRGIVDIHQLLLILSPEGDMAQVVA